MTENKNLPETGLEIAVIGMAGKFPGSKNLEEFRENTEKGVETISFFSTKELKDIGINDRILEHPGYIRAFGILEDKAYFDSSFFGYSPKEAETMDPVIRLFHECAWEALEDAGYDPMSYNGSIGVYAGSSDGFGWRAAATIKDIKEQNDDFSIHLTDNGLLLSTWVSYKLNLRGPSITMFTACSTSLVTIHTACRALLTGECDIALAGAGSVTAQAKTGYFYQEGMIMSPDGHCRTFDEKAKGTVYGEGIGIVVLKRLKGARTGGDTIKCVIKASAINNDGTGKASFTAPGKKRIADVVRTVLKLSRVSPEEIGFIETHGTATPLGDAIEIEALKEAFDTGKKGYCGLSSIKSNIGHLDVAAGIAGFIKAVQALIHKSIPPSLHFETPNPTIDFINSPFYIDGALTPWENNGFPLRAGVCSFGIGGTNAFILLEEAADGESVGGYAGESVLIILSARTQPALEKMTENLAGYLKKNPGINLADAAYTLQVGRRAFNHRRMLVCAAVNEAVEALLSPDAGKVLSSVLGSVKPAVEPPKASDPLNEIGMAWLKGAKIDWAEFYAKYPDRKGRRVPLPTYPFEGQYYWIDTGPLEPGPVERDEGDWFYIPSWERWEGSFKEKQDDVVWLLFLDEHGLGGKLAGQLRRNNREVVIVRAGLNPSFSKTGANEFMINPAKEDHYETLFKGLKKWGKLPRRIVHLWGISGTGQTDDGMDRALELGFYSLTGIAKAVGSGGMDEGLQILVVTDNLQEVTGDEAFLCPQKAPVLGAVKVIPLEYANISCRSVDIVLPRPGSGQEEIFVDYMLHEFGEDFSINVVAYRGSHRWVRVFKPTRLERPDEKQTPPSSWLKQKGVYLITGGFGGIGFTFAQYLAKTVRARLILVGRSVSSVKEEYKEKQKQLEKAGAEVMAAGVDAADEEGMEKIIRQAETRFGPIDGILHTAGVIDDAGVIQKRTRQETEEVLAAKVKGTLVLDRIFSKKAIKPGVFVLFSSLGNIIYGNRAGQSGYNAANEFLDAFAYHRNKPRRHVKGREEVVTVNWAPWQERGMAVKAAAGGSLPGEAILPSEGIDVLNRIMATAFPRVVVCPRDLAVLAERVNKPPAAVREKEKAETSPKLYQRPQLSTEYTAPRDETERSLAAVWRKFFAVQEVGIHDDFFELGGDSLKAITVVTEIHKRLEARVPITEIFQSPTIAGLARYIKGMGKDEYSAVKSLEQKEYYPLSSVQKRIYILQQIEVTSMGYNNPLIFELGGQLDAELLENTFNRLVRRHESLRTSFEEINGETVQRVHPKKQKLLRGVQGGGFLEMSPPGRRRQIKKFIRPFDLSQAPLLRVGVHRIDKDRHLLMTDMHHIVTDGTSIGILIREFMSLYSGRSLFPLRIQYKDYAYWQGGEKQKGVMKKQGAFWLDQFEGEIPVLNLPADFARPAVQDFAGSTKFFSIGRREVEALKAIASEEDATLFMVLLSLYTILLAKICGQEDIVVGSPITGRNHADLQHVIGMLVNTLALRNFPSRRKTFREFLREVRNRTLAAYENQDYLFEDLVEQVTLNVNRDVSRNPLFDTWFGLHNFQSQYEAGLDISIPGLTLKVHRHDRGVSVFDLTVQAVEGEGEDGVSFTIDFSSKLFKPETIDRVIAYLGKIVAAVVEAPDGRTAEIEIIPEEEKKQILYEFNTVEDFGTPEQSVHELFRGQVEKTPYRTALVYKENHLTYGELKRRSNGLAGLLRKKGVGPDVIVGVMIERSLEMIIALSAVLEAGGVVLPLDPQYPGKRILAMLKDSGASLLLSKESSLKDFSIASLMEIDACRAKPVVTPRCIRIKKFDGLPYPDRTLVDYRKYHRYIGIAAAKHAVSIQATRGCPYNCAFCHKIWPKKHVARSAENLFQEIQNCYRGGVKRFVFIDDIFNLDSENNRLLLEKISRHLPDVQLFFPNGLRADILTTDFIDLMVEAGAVNIVLALESASPRIQKLIGKNLNLEKFKKNILYIAEKYPWVELEVEMMVGFPGETEEEALMTIELLESIKWVHFPNLHILKIYPNTDMYRVALENGIPEEKIESSIDLAYHELPETLPFSKSFVSKLQGRLLNEYVLSRERLLKVLPGQAKNFTEDEIIQKYDSYLPMKITRIADILQAAGIPGDALSNLRFVPDRRWAVPDFNRNMGAYFPRKAKAKNAFRILLIDASLEFSGRSGARLYDVVEAPLGLMYLLSYLEEQSPEQVIGKIIKARIDFDSYEELHAVISKFKPNMIGIRTLSYYKNFFHKLAAVIRQWKLAVDVPIIAGGPYASSDYMTMLLDFNIDLAVIGEGEHTLARLVKEMIENDKKLPHENVLQGIRGIAFVKKQDKEAHKTMGRDVILLDAFRDRRLEYPAENLENKVGPGNLIYVIYTSGSTGKPKGVMLQHRNLLNLIQYQYRHTSIDFSRVLQFTTISFDVSFQEIFSTLPAGGTLFLVPPETIKHIPRLFRVIENNRIKTLFLPASFLKFIFNQPEYASIFPGCVGHIVTAGEQVIVTDSFRAYLKSNNVYLHNHYGPSETHVVTALTLDPRCAIPALPPIGTPLTNTYIYILDKSRKLQPVGIAGELFIGGIQVGRGYLNNPELTGKNFCLSKQKFCGGAGGGFSKEPPARRRHVYTTGDLSRWLVGGIIEFLGRMDQQVKIRGFRIEPGEIENRLLDMTDIKEAVVVVRDGVRGGGDKYLCAYVALAREKKVDLTGLKNDLAKVLPDYMVPSFFVSLEKIPLTPNGKVDRKALPEPGKDNGAERTAPASKVEIALARLWAEVLGMEKESIGIDADFFQLGGHSLKATLLTAKIHKRFNVELTLGEMFKRPTIRELANYIKEAGEKKYTSIEPAEKKDYYPMSSAQKRLYIIQQIDPDSTAYHMPQAMVLAGDIDKAGLEKTFRRLVRRHEAFRTSFVTVDEEPVQRVHEGNYKSQIANYKLQITDIVKEFIQPFDLSKAPLLRVGLVKLEEQKYLLLVDKHHIISDGISVRISVREFMELSRGVTLPELRIQYKDYSQWQNSAAVKSKITAQEEYWLKEFAGEVPVLNLPYDAPRPAVQDFKGGTFGFDIGEQDTAALNRLALDRGVTLFMVLAAVFNVCLAKLSGREDIVFGTPTAGRGHADLEKIIGMLVNTLALCNFPNPGKTFAGFLHELGTRTLAAFENQDYPFEDLVEKVAVRRDAGRSPLFDVMFALQNMDEISGMPREIDRQEQEEEFDIDTGVSRFDMTWNILEKNKGLVFEIEYSTRLFKQETIKRFAACFKRAAAFATAFPLARIADIEIIPEEEKQRILFEFNTPGTAYPRDKSIAELFEEQARKNPGAVAVAGKAAKGPAPLNVTYSELNKKSGRLAQVLKEKGVQPGTIAAIMTEFSPAAIVDILAILKAGGAYLPIDPNYPEQRKQYILKDSNAKIVMTGETHPAPSGHPSQEGASHPAASLAYLIYTSGSTGRPKGVMVEHRGVVRLVKNTSYIKFKEKDRILQTGAPVFDASTFEIWGALLNGLTLYLTTKEDILSPVKLKRAITLHDITILWLTSPLFNQVSTADVEVFAGLKYLLVGGDVLSPFHINRVKNRFPRLNVIDGYGPTENTTFSTTFLIDKAYKERIPIGKPIANSTAYIINKEGHLQPVGVPGELAVGGDGLARGYLNNPELTAEKFIAANHRSYMSYISKRIYRSGDLGRWLADGSIEFLGRMDLQVKVRGFRIELEEIEDHLLKHPGVREVVVLAKGHEKLDKFLCAYVVEKSVGSAASLREFLSRSLPDYMIPSYFMKLEKIPLTANGKVDTKALPAPGIEAGGKYTAPKDGLEKQLVGIWSGVLSLDKDVIGTDANFFEMGGHSLRATVMTARIHKELGVKIPLGEIFRTPSIKGLAQYIRAAGSVEDKYRPVEAVEKKDYYILSSAQKRLYILQQMETESTVYNIPQLVPLAVEGEIETVKGKLEKTFRQLIRRHESFRTSFTAVDEEPVQRVHDTGGEEKRRSEETHHSSFIIHHFIRPFDLSKAPLLRVEVIERALLVDMHHIISDGVSMEILVREFMGLYSGEKLPMLRVQYKDYAEWQNSEAVKEQIKEQEKFQLKEFSGEIPVLDLPLDYPRPAIQVFEGNSIDFEIDENSFMELSRLTVEQGATMYMVLAAVFNVFLSKMTGGEDIIIGTPVAGRGHADVQGIIGMFVNTLALRNYPDREKTFGRFIKEVKGRTLEAFENQDYPFEELVEKVDASRDVSRNPLFDVMFAYEMNKSKTTDSNEHKFDYRVSKFDLTLTASETGSGLLFNIEYCTGLFKEETIRRFIDYFRRVLKAAAAVPSTAIGRIDMVGEEGKKRILYEFNGTEVEYPRHMTFPELFDRQVEKTPYRVAVVYGQSRLTYEELNKRAGHLAGTLTEGGIVTGSIVGIMLERSFEMIIAILAVLKAGGGYLPIDPDYPEERKQYMLADSGAVLLNTENTKRKSPSPFTPLTSPAYIIYTSGSTGRPKGVMVEHRNLTAYINAFLQEFQPGPDDAVILEASFSFDAFVEEVYPILLRGGKLCIAKKNEVMDVRLLRALLEKYNITIISCSPLLLNELNKLDRVASIHTYISGADVLKGEYVDRLLKFGGVYNTYGPTETAVCAAYYKLPEAFGANIPIGKPIANYRLYVVDKMENVQPVGIPGELWISGEGIARGYLNNPELSAEKFIPPDHRSYRSYVSYISKRIYRSGDLGRWLPDGNIEFLGRIDRQVKIRGYRIELEEIESLLLHQEGVKDAVIIDREAEDEDKYLCAYLITVGGNRLDIDGLKELLSGKLPGYMMPSYFVQLEKMPLTPSGKINRSALPAPSAETAARYTAPQDIVEDTLARLWAEVLQIPSIGILDNFFQLGGHSLKATVLAAKVHKALNVQFPLAEIFRNPTVKGMAQYIAKAVKKNFAPLRPVEKKDYYVLSSAQKRLYILQQMELESTVYNMPAIIPLANVPDLEKLKNNFKQLINRHEALRTSFHVFKEEPVQRIYDRRGEPPCSPLWVEETINNFVKPFDLSKAPLLLLGLAGSTLLVDMHHIISDGISTGILQQEFTALYNGEGLPELAIQYKDYAVWQNSAAVKEQIKQQEKYWLEEFPGEIPLLKLPLDYPRPTVQRFEGHSIDFEIDEKKTTALNRLALEQGVTMYMLSAAVFNVFLSRLSLQEDIVTGTPVAGRGHADVQGIIGMFVNTLTLRTHPHREKSFRFFLNEIKTKTLQAFENRDYPFEDLVDYAAVERDVARNPLFDIMFTFDNMNTNNHRLRRPGGLILKKPPPWTPRKNFCLKEPAKFDLTVGGMQTGGKLFFTFQYCTKLFKEETIHTFIDYFKNTISAVLENIDTKLADIEIISEKERKQLLFDFNNRETQYPINKTIHQLFEEQAARTPGHIAVTSTVSLTYRELNKKSAQPAHLLREKGVLPDDMIGITANRSIEMIAGILGILKSGCAYVPLDPKAPEARRKYILAECNIKILLTDNSLSRLDGQVRPLPGRVAEGRGGLAYVIFTSGSTGKPKGVPITHANISPLLHWGYGHLGLGPKDRTIQNLAYYFDWSVWEIFITLTTGACLYMVSHELLLDTSESITFMNKHGITVLHVTPTQYRFYVSASRQLETLKYLFIGAEKLTFDLAKHSFETVKTHCRIFNMYGPTEAAIISSVLEIHRGRIEQYQHLSSVPIGYPAANALHFILDNSLKLCPVNVPGQLYIAGPGLSNGYLNNPELTAERFLTAKTREGTRRFNRSYRSYMSYMTKRIYKTGDISRWLLNGIIEFLGRSDHQVKIRGYRIELGEIEQQLLQHNQVNEVLVKSVGDNENYLCAYVVTKSTMNVEKMREYLTRTLPGYMIPTYFMPIDRIPLNPNGKVDLKALPEPVLKSEAGDIRPANEKETRLIKIWSEVLGIEERMIGTGSDFFQLGGHSLKAAVLTAKIHKELDIKCPLTDLFRFPTIRKLAAHISGITREQFTAVKPAEKKEYYISTSAQKRLYVLQQLVPDSTVYNMPQFIPLAEEPHLEKLENTFKELIKRHESLRTSFVTVNEEPVQMIHDRRGEPPCSPLWDFLAIHHSVRPFDLSQAPLLRVGLAKNVLLVDMHHIISDGVSLQILQEDFMRLYNGKELPSLKIQYKDYAQWQNNVAQKQAIQKQETYWLDRFAGEIPVLELPFDYDRPAIQDFEGTTLDFQFSEDVTTTLNRLALKEGVTPFMVLFSLFNILLAKLSGRQDIVVGTPLAGRNHADLQKIIGMFVKTLALRSYPGEEKSFNEFLKEVKEHTLQAFENQDYPFEDLVEKVQVNRDTGRSPLFDVMFALQTSSEEEALLPAAEETAGKESAKFDITLAAVQTAKQIYFSLQYSTRLFKKQTIQRFIAYFKKITSETLPGKERKIGDIEIITAEEKNQILLEFNGTHAAYPHDKTIHELFEEQAERTPDSTAVMAMRHALSYKELNEVSARLAHILKQKGVQPGAVVGIMIERSIEMMIGIMAILKTGCAYLPIDPHYPGKRTHYMLADSRAAILLTIDDIVSNLNSLSVSVVAKKTPATFPAYIIFTSGSTGTPKGVIIEHRSVINRLNWMQRAYPIGPGDVILQKTPIVFDVSVWELFWWGFYGASLAILGPGDEKNPAAIIHAIETYRITTMHFVPSMLNAFLDHLESFAEPSKPLLPGLRRVFASGEALTPAQVERFNRLLLVKLVNLYGPTEATVDVSYFNCPKEEKIEKIPIGKPIDNTQLYILDNYLHVLPVGITGELYIAGTALARGYLNRPELTAENFRQKFCGGPGGGFSKEPPGRRRQYKTGDLCRWMGDGNIEFLGRIDHQVKIRGFRIELDEIRQCLSDCLPVKDAVVIARRDSGGDNRLYAYIVPDDDYAFTVKQAIRLKEKAAREGQRYYELPNGMTVYYLNRSETDFMYREIFEEGTYLKHGITLRQSACIFDIGANVGLFSLFVRQKCPAAKIYAFEPIPPLYELLELNAQLYGTNFRTFNIGLSSQAGEVEFIYYPHASILSGVFAHSREEKETVKAFIKQELAETGGEKITEEEIDGLLAERLTGTRFMCGMKTLSQVIRENNIEAIDLLKIDVEKAEIDVLEGIVEDDWVKIRQLVIEVHNSDGRLDRIRQLLETRGYTIEVEQDNILAETGLYNLYARRAGEEEQETQSQPVEKWYSTNRLTGYLREVLEGKLPGYMVPSFIIPIVDIPLTISGKVDRRALPLPDVKAVETYTPPADEIEVVLVEIWAEVLNQAKESISTTANFFESGGHSLRATSMVSKVKDRFDCLLPLAEIFKTPFIKPLAEYINKQKFLRGSRGPRGAGSLLKKPSVAQPETNLRAESQELRAEPKYPPGHRRQDKNLVLLKSGKDNAAHIFFIHDGSGEVESYIEFCNLLNVEFNCWGIRADRFAGFAPRRLTIEELAKNYIETVKTIQPGGPYYFVGWSIGGTIAFEMARQMEKDDEIRLLALIDVVGPQPDRLEEVEAFTFEGELAFVKKYLPGFELGGGCENLEDIQRLWLLVVEYLEGADVDIEIIRKVITEYEAHVVPDYSRLGIGELIGYLNMGRTFHRAREIYLPAGKISASFCYFGVDGSEGIVDKEQWSNYVERHVKFSRLSGDHFSILKKPAVLELVKSFEKTITPKNYY